MFSDSDGLPGRVKRFLVRLAAFYMAQQIAESAQIFAGRLRDNADQIPAADALMAFSKMVRAIGSNEMELGFVVASVESEANGPFH